MEDYFLLSQQEQDTENDQNGDLCCCEYINHKNQRFHIITCCCNCEDFDIAFTKWISCRPVDQSCKRKMLITFQDRLRIPWRGGAKQVALVSLVPVFVIPLLICLAAINAYTCIVIFSTCTVIMCYAFYYIQRKRLRTRFFIIWIISSLVYLIVLFECTVPLLEVLPEENCALGAFSLASLICLYKTHRRSKLNYVIEGVGTNNDMLPELTEENVPNEHGTQTTLYLNHDSEDISPTDSVKAIQAVICSICSKSVPARTAHCSICSACIKRHDHHSYWLNCCIGESNHIFYIAGILFGVLALLLGADLTLTAVCHPFLAANVFGLQILLPDDCSEVFDMYELGLAFVIAVYALLIAAYNTAMLVRQIYFISRGITLYECQRGLRGNNRSFKYNWKSFVF